MASNVRKGKIPYKPTGCGEYVDQVYSLKGFFGEWVHSYRQNNLAHPVRWSDARMMLSGLDGATLTASDADDPRGEPLRLLEGKGVAVSLSQRSAAMPFCEKNVDAHQIRFYHRGHFLLETELGPLEIEPGDFVVIPRGLIYRETPKQAEGNVVHVFESDSVINLAEDMWESVGYAGLFVNYSEMEIPEPGPEQAHPEGREWELRVRYDGEWHALHYDFDPCADVVGWIGDPVIFKMNVWNIPTSGTNHGQLTPPSGAVLVGENRDFLFNVLGQPPSPTVPSPQGSVGAPAHQNDYDELWITHALERAPETEGHIWLLPRTLPHPGIKRPVGPPAPVNPRAAMRINFDTKTPMWWTPEVREQLFADPILEKYTSFFAMPAAQAPEKVRRISAAHAATREGR